MKERPSPQFILGAETDRDGTADYRVVCRQMAAWSPRSLIA